LLNRILILVAVLCVINLACGKAPVACAGWGGPPIIPQQPRFEPPQPQPPQPLPKDFLQPTLKSVPSAPPVVTGNGQGNSQAGIVEDKPAVESPRPEPLPSVPAAKPVPPPPPVEKPLPVPPAESSGSKTPWFLVAGGVVAAFMLGRRKR
jgi:hypothetical protein